MNRDQEQPVASRLRQRLNHSIADGQRLPLLELLAQAAPLRAHLVANSGGCAAAAADPDGDLSCSCYLAAQAIASLDTLQRLHAGGAHAALITMLWDDLAGQVPDPLPDLPYCLGDGGAEQLKATELKAICRAAGLRGADSTKAAMRVRPLPCPALPLLSSPAAGGPAKGCKHPQALV